MYLLKDFGARFRIFLYSPKVAWLKPEESYSTLGHSNNLCTYIKSNGNCTPKFFQT